MANNSTFTRGCLIEAILRNISIEGTAEYNKDDSATGVQVAEYVHNPNGFNISNVMQWIKSGNNGRSPLHNASTGYCAKYVRFMLEAGGIDTSGHPVSAVKYAGWLPSRGFRNITTLSGRAQQEEWTRSSAIPGDIAVMAHGEHGHICMYTGYNWVSDFRQNRMWPYSGDGVCYIFRFE
jgi:hypothetical protein